MQSSHGMTVCTLVMGHFLVLHKEKFVCVCVLRLTDVNDLLMEI